jgi:hypothetical protein
LPSDQRDRAALNFALGELSADLFLRVLRHVTRHRDKSVAGKIE